MSADEVTLLALDLATRPSIIAARVAGVTQAVRGVSTHPLADLGARVRDVLGQATPEVVGVVTGPGSVLGLRAGAAFVRTYASATGATLVPLHTGEAVAASVPDEPVLWVVAPVGRGRVSLVATERGQVVSEAIVGVEELRIPRGEPVAGPGLARGLIGEGRSTGVVEPTGNGLLAALVRRWRAGESADPHSLAVRYSVDAGVRLPRRFAEGGGRP
ncbi:peptidase M22 glycoprotease [Acidimicrobium ferrooxidans DSM 10331]|uniref:Peptidase M22 glycoprotease n=1 Tax=Acidimicrobium ferrooxidans (strain DSM 10331 / JCM 15462 / NBRC 103882 / ICP) TaxID=525909 RepID=C7M314_ACIFD|nr:peptidase M22 [Acidimicrobium ferrooxidans]ACU53408.1 peptidase M22 glycoprotease [Acidimicrobium ferrooxidans DSM 10331]